MGGTEFAGVDYVTRLPGDPNLVRDGYGDGLTTVEEAAAALAAAVAEEEVPDAA
ncbi:hypothetical protein FWD20_01270 [Candidatus Saccharibacteria bacterium]|nr:hypothetical protein [Candidatus Saccharibacteria bacterium]